MITRRRLLALAGGALAVATLTPVQANDAPIRIGLAGAESEGIVLAKDAMRADARIRLVAIADPSRSAAWRAHSIFAHPLRRGGVHPQLELDEDALFAGSDAVGRMIKAIPLDAVLLVGPGSSVVTGLAFATAARVDAFAKPLGFCDAALSGELTRIAATASASGVVVGADVPWRYEADEIPRECRLDYARSQGARTQSFAAFLRARELRQDHSAGLTERLQLLADPAG